MDFGRIIQMVINQLLRRAVNGGVDAAMRQVSRRSGVAGDDQDDPRAASLSAKQASKRMRQVTKLTRKF
jgi:hypothetical protein